MTSQMGYNTFRQFDSSTVSSIIYLQHALSMVKTQQEASTSFTDARLERITNGEQSLTSTSVRPAVDCRS